MAALREVYIRLTSADLRGDVALVTGAGSGIGREITLILAAEGCQLVLWGRREAPLLVVAEEAREAARKAGVSEPAILVQSVDVSSQTAVEAAGNKVLADFGRVDLLVNNAGISNGPDLKLERSPAEIEQLIATNVMSHFWTLKAFLAGMVDRDHGHIVTVGSAAGMIGVAGMMDYSASKFALRGLNEALRMSLKRLGSNVRCTMVSPSYIDTGMFEGVDPGFLGGLIMPVLTPKSVATDIVQATKRGSTELLLPPIVNVVDLLRGIFPASAFDLTAVTLGISNSLDGFKQTRENPRGTLKSML